MVVRVIVASAVATHLEHLVVVIAFHAWMSAMKSMIVSVLHVRRAAHVFLGGRGSAIVCMNA